MYFRIESDHDKSRVTLVKNILADLAALSLKNKMKTFDSNVSLSSMCDRVSDVNSVSAEDVESVQTVTKST